MRCEKGSRYFVPFSESCAITQVSFVNPFSYAKDRRWGTRFMLGPVLISPFYELFPSFGSGAIGLFILFWGMQYAWKAMAAPKVEVDGPLAVAQNSAT